MAYSFSYAAAGNDADACIAAGDEHCYLKVPKDADWLKRIKDLTLTDNTDNAFYNVPFHQMALINAWAIRDAVDFAAFGDAWVVDTITHAETHAYTLDAARLNRP